MKNSKRSKTRSAKGIAKIVDRAIMRRAERKLFDSTISQVQGTGVQYFALSQAIIQGIGGGQRVGDNIHMEKIFFNYRIEAAFAGVATTLGCMARVIVVLDRANDGATPATADLLLTSTITSPWSPEQIKSKRFRILYDKIHVLSNQGAYGVTAQKVIPIGASTYYQGTTSTTAANGRNSMWAVCYSTDNTNPPSFNMDFEIVYTDL